jgi:hypothetical protein
MKKKLTIILTTILILFSLGGCSMTTGQTSEGGSIAFLKEHEEEMADYVKEQNPKVTSVTFDWDSVEIGKIGNGTPQGGGELLTLFGYVNGDKKLDFGMNMPVKNGKIQIKKLGIGQALTDF